MAMFVGKTVEVFLRNGNHPDQVVGLFMEVFYVGFFRIGQSIDAHMVRIISVERDALQVDSYITSNACL